MVMIVHEVICDRCGHTVVTVTGEVSLEIGTFEFSCRMCGEKVKEDVEELK